MQKASNLGGRKGLSDRLILSYIEDFCERSLAGEPIFLKCSKVTVD